MDGFIDRTAASALAVAFLTAASALLMVALGLALAPTLGAPLTCALLGLILLCAGAGLFAMARKQKPRPAPVPADPLVSVITPFAVALVSELIGSSSNAAQQERASRPA